MQFLKNFFKKKFYYVVYLFTDAGCDVRLNDGKFLHGLLVFVITFELHRGGALYLVFQTFRVVPRQPLHFILEAFFIRGGYAHQHFQLIVYRRAGRTTNLFSLRSICPHVVSESQYGGIFLFGNAEPLDDVLTETLDVLSERRGVVFHDLGAGVPTGATHRAGHVCGAGGSTLRGRPVLQTLSPGQFRRVPKSRGRAWVVTADGHGPSHHLVGGLNRIRRLHPLFKFIPELPKCLLYRFRGIVEAFL